MKRLFKLFISFALILATLGAYAPNVVYAGTITVNGIEYEMRDTTGASVPNKDIIADNSVLYKELDSVTGVHVKNLNKLEDATSAAIDATAVATTSNYYVRLMLVVAGYALIEGNTATSLAVYNEMVNNSISNYSTIIEDYHVNGMSDTDRFYNACIAGNSKMYETLFDVGKTPGENLFNQDNFGIVADKAPTSTTSGYTDIGNLTKAAVTEMVIQYAWHANAWRRQIVNTKTLDEAHEDQSIQMCLKQLYLAQKTLGNSTYIPALSKFWQYKEDDADYSLEDLYNTNNDPDEQTPINGNAADDAQLDSIKEDNALLQFYRLNSYYGIASIDKQSIYNDDAPTSNNQSATVQEMQDLTNGISDFVGRVRGKNQELDYKETLETRDNEFLIGNTGIENKTTETQFNGVSESGEATTHHAVTISKGILQGMIYSSTFVPMKTNLYSPEVLNSMDDDGYLEGFYMKYGFQRKALKWDKSKTSVLDYYNAGDRLTHNLQIVTLRDILDNCENDLALFVDDDFYNADEAVETANTLLDSREKVNKDIYDLLSAYPLAKMWSEQQGTNTPATNDNLQNAPIADMFEQPDAPTSSTSTTPNQTQSQVVQNATSGVTHKLQPVVDLFAVSGHVLSATALASIDQALFEQSFRAALDNALITSYNYNPTEFSSDDTKCLEHANAITTAATSSDNYKINEQMLKDGTFTAYDEKVESAITSIENSSYSTVLPDNLAQDNFDTIVLPSSMINDTLDCESEYTKKIKAVDRKTREEILQTTLYTAIDNYTPLLSTAFVSAIYRDANVFSLANSVASNNPVFLSSKTVCGLDDATQWYKNTILNYCLVNNLKAAAQLDYNFVMDLDSPLYIDIYGNILTESGIVVIPAASNATLHTGSYYKTNLALGLYTVYGKSYYLPVTVTGAADAMFPFFTIDKNLGVYIVNNVDVYIGDQTVKYAAPSPFNDMQKAAVREAYKHYIFTEGLDTDTTSSANYSEVFDETYLATGVSRLNWVAMVNIINEVMRGAPIENIDAEKEGIYTDEARNKASVVAAVKFENLVKYIKNSGMNSILALPDFTRMKHVSVFVIMAMKILFVITTALAIILIYRDAAASQLSLRTFWKVMSAILLTFCSVAVIPAVFQVTYYSANKYILQNEVDRILMYTLESQEGGIEIGMTDIQTPETTQDMSLQLNYIRVPWWEQLNMMLYSNAIAHYNDVAYEAWQQTPIHDHYDVEVYNDGVYTNLKTLFESVEIDFDFQTEVQSTYDTSTVSQNTHGLYLHQHNPIQTAGFYTPYYAFLNSLAMDCNIYNNSHSMSNYTTKYMSGNRLKTVGWIEPYLTSKQFMEDCSDLLHISHIYNLKIPGYTDYNPYTSEDLEKIKQSYWYCFYSVDHTEKRLQLMNDYAREYIARNKDMLTKVSDETFLKVMALSLANKYNQIFGIPVANAVEIYNLDSDSLLRLCIAKPEDTMLSITMSYPRFIYTFAGEPGIYMASILEVIMWMGSYLKPLCTILVFISVFLSIWVFRVLLQRPSANLWGYFITVTLLCVTNLLHAVILKIGCWLPSMNLSSLGCILFLIVGQVLYLIALAWVTGIALKDWSNLGYNEYSLAAQKVKAKIGKDKLAADNLNGRVKHHDNNWDYYNDLVTQHRERNA